MRKLNAIKFDSLPLDQAVKIQRGNGKRVVAMFSDPHCPYLQARSRRRCSRWTTSRFTCSCSRSFDPELADQSKAVWCSPDRSEGLARPRACAASRRRRRRPVRTRWRKTFELGRSIGVNSTPTLILASGERVGGGAGRRRFHRPPRREALVVLRRAGLAARPQEPQSSRCWRMRPAMRACVGARAPEEIRAHRAANGTAGVLRGHQPVQRLVRQRERRGKKDRRAERNEPAIDRAVLYCAHERHAERADRRRVGSARFAKEHVARILVQGILQLAPGWPRPTS